MELFTERNTRITETFLLFVRVAGKLKILMEQKSGYSIQHTENQQEHPSAVLSMSFTDWTSSQHGKVPSYDSSHPQGQGSLSFLLSTDSHNNCLCSDFAYLLPTQNSSCPPIPLSRWSKIFSNIQTYSELNSTNFFFPVLARRFNAGSNFLKPQCILHLMLSKCKFHAYTL